MNDDLSFDFSKNRLDKLQTFVGKSFRMDYCDMQVCMLLGGEVGPPFFMCKIGWSDSIICMEPMELLSYFDDEGNAVGEFE